MSDVRELEIRCALSNQHSINSMASKAYVTLLTSENYLPGTLVLAKSLKKTGTKIPFIVLVCGDSLSDEAKQVLARNADDIIYAPILKSDNAENLRLLGRAELDITYSKLHVFNPELFAFDRICFLDSDVLILQSIDRIFSFVDHPATVFAAAPDVGWPDCFNSGVFVTKPSKQLYQDIVHASKTVGSFDGLLLSYRWRSRAPQQLLFRLAIAK